MIAADNTDVLVTLPSDREITFTCTFRHNRSRLFDAWTQPRHIRQWWGCDGTRVLECDIDLRQGGAWRIVGWMPESGAQTFSGVYQEIIPARQLVYTERYEAPQFGDPNWQTMVTFDDVTDGTRLTHTILHLSREARDMHLKVGMETGAKQSLARLDECLRALKRRGGAVFIG